MSKLQQSKQLFINPAEYAYIPKLIGADFTQHARSGKNSGNPCHEGGWVSAPRALTIPTKLYGLSRVATITAKLLGMRPAWPQLVLNCLECTLHGRNKC